MSSRMIIIVLFGLVILNVLALDRRGRRPESKIPTLGELLGYLAAKPVGRTFVLALWAWTGWHFFAR
ncbi:MAG: hypothetical protein HYR62_03985 [Actinobacteria bacterium]|nr:hypothetical protein [Actinomycetota bacterium]MBI3686677.1 hypothetical protein [Actinomycetota bacterium]